MLAFYLHRSNRRVSPSGYLESCKAIVGAAKDIQTKIKAEIPELYILGNPPASVVAFASKHPAVNPLEVGDLMAKRGWHLNALADPPAVHIAVTVSKTPWDTTSELTSLRSD